MGTSTQHVDLPGRLGDPDRTIGADPRPDARLAAVPAPLAPVTAASSDDEQIAFSKEAEPGFQMLFAALDAQMAPIARSR